MPKALLIFPRRYTYTRSINEGLRELGWEVMATDHLEALSPTTIKLNPVLSFMPGRFRRPWQRRMIHAVNDHYKALIKRQRPDLVFIYNNEFMLPETLEFCKKHTRVAFFLGDHPLYSLTFDYNLHILKYSSCTIAPDSHWLNELCVLGMPNVVFDMMAASEAIFHPVKTIPTPYLNIYGSDTLFIGTCYPMASGYKRALFLDSARTDGLKIFGPANWYKWLEFFPALKQHFHLQPQRITDAELNLALNCAKLCPIDQNQGIINGIHNRVFEAIGAGTLPVIEYRKDIDTVFGERLPVIREYCAAREIVLHWLDDAEARERRIQDLRTYVQQNYSPMAFLKRLVEKAFA